MKANTRNIMESKWDVDYMRMYWRPQRLHSKHTSHSYNRKFKNKWRKEIKRQFDEELKDIDKDE